MVITMASTGSARIAAAKTKKRRYRMHSSIEDEFDSRCCEQLPAVPVQKTIIQAQSFTACALKLE